MKKKFLSKIRMQSLQDSINFLEYYEEVPNEIHVIGESLEEIDPEMTELLQKLGKINTERAEVINKLMQK